MVYRYPAPVTVDFGDTVCRDGVQRQELRFTISGATLFRAFRLAPENAAGPLPTIVAFMGHGTVSQLLDEPESYQKALATDFASAGYLVYAMENVGMSPEGDIHRDIDQALRLTGWSWYSLLFAHLRMLLGVVFADDQVDPDRIGATGVSTGGFLTLVAAALEPRISAASVHGFWGAMRDFFITDRERHCTCGAVPGLLPEFDLPVLAALVAPRALHFSTAQDDSFRPESAAAWTERMRPVFAALDPASPYPTFTSPPGGHAFGLDAAREFFTAAFTEEHQPHMPEIEAAPPPEPQLIPHRGLTSVAPENTVPAFRTAAAAGMGTEFDVYETVDGEVVIMHDPTVDRTTDGPGRITEFTFAELRALDAGGWFHPYFAATPVPTLREALQALRCSSVYQAPIAIQMKQEHDAFIAKVAAIVREEGAADRAFLFAFKPSDAQRAKRIAGDIAVVVAAQRPDDLQEIAANASADGVWTYFVPTVAQAEMLHRAGKSIYVSPLVPQNDDVYRQFHAARVTAVCTDFPLECRRVWRQMREGG